MSTKYMTKSCYMCTLLVGGVNAGVNCHDEHGSPLMILECMPYGDLKQFLVDHRYGLDMKHIHIHPASCCKWTLVSVLKRPEEGRPLLVTTHDQYGFARDVSTVHMIET